MASGRPSTTHGCPGRCGRRVQRALFACAACWRRLPRGLREPITDNHLVNPAAHLAAMSAACDWYRAHTLVPGIAVEPTEREERCELTDLLVDHCAHCKGVGVLEQELMEQRARLLATPRWIPAQYAGECDVCGDRFGPGAAIRKSGNGWRAECCAEEDGGARA